MNINSCIRNTQGFTLIELAVVVSIIGILAAIAISLFASYRVRSFNSTAVSDVRNLATSENAFFADLQSFGITAQNVTVQNGSGDYLGSTGLRGVLITGPPASGKSHALTITPYSQDPEGMLITVSNNVSMVANVDLITQDNPRSASYTLGGKHIHGDTYYGKDSDTAIIWQNQSSSKIGIAMEQTDIPLSKARTDEFDSVAGPNGKIWIVK